MRNRGMLELLGGGDCQIIKDTGHCEAFAAADTWGEGIYSNMANYRAPDSLKSIIARILPQVQHLLNRE